jgi:hypothetical protein
MKFAPTTAYQCVVSLKNEFEAQVAFDSLVKLVARLRTDWAVFQPPPSVLPSVGTGGSAQVTKAIFSIKDQTDNDLATLKFETAVEVNRMHQVAEHIKLDSVTLSVAVGHIPAMVQSRFERVTNSNRNTPLPSPQATSNSTAVPASTILSFTNNTAFPIELILTGPTISGKKIAPSETRDVTVPSGKYSILADFPTSSNLVSFYGTQDYLPNFHYVYKLDTPTNTNGSSTNIDSEIAKILSHGPVSALPTRQVSQSGSSGLPTLAITNSTQYSLRILASGPTPGDYTILPGATQDITVSPGSYKIVGTVSASDVLPFSGTEDYASGTKYVYRFYIR